MNPHLVIEEKHHLVIQEKHHPHLPAKEKIFDMRFLSPNILLA